MIVGAVARRHGASVRVRNGHVAVKRGADEFWLPSSQLALVPYVAQNFDLFFSAIHTTPDANGIHVADFSVPKEHQLVHPPIIVETAGFPDRLDFEVEYFHWYSPQPGDTVWDLGANIGIAALVMSRLVGPTGRVVAVEPDPVNFKYLLANLAREGVDNVTAVNCAVSDRVGKASFFSDGTMFSGLATTRSDGVFQKALGETVDIDTETLDSLAAKFPRPAFIKMDIEGAEIEALAEASSALNHLPAIACETNHVRGGRRTQFAVEESLRVLGYEVDTGRPLGSFITWAREPH